MSREVGAGVSIVVAGGGTAGHIEPAMAFADAVRRLAPDARITALGTTKGLDTRLIPARGYPLELIPPVPLPRRPGRALLQTPGRVRGAVAATRAVLERVGADVVVGFGGYVAVPAYLAARAQGLPIVVHEANARPGLGNRLAVRLTRHVFTASPEVRLPHARAIGIPLRPSITSLDRDARRAAARAGFGLDPDRPTLLVTGGSQGARSINEAALAAAPALRAAGIQVLHVAGPKNPIEAPPGEVPYVVVGYVDGMADAYAACDFALCRCGAMTCAELTAVGLPAAYVPYPHGNGEQRFNALPIVTAGGGMLVEDAELDADWISAHLVPVLADPARTAAMAVAARRVGSRDADSVLARYVLDLIGAAVPGSGR